MSRKDRELLEKTLSEKHAPVLSILMGLHAAVLALPGFLLLTIPGPTMDLLQWEVCNMTIIRLVAVSFLTIAFLTFQTIQTPPMHAGFAFIVLIFFDVGVALAVLLSLVEDESARTWSFTAALGFSIFFTLVWVFYKGHYEKMAVIRQLNSMQKRDEESEC